ncbi:D-tyrosyl-tRNA(Tyr) deacylase [Cryptococcus amylolentus CBS 6039]|uniref:D-aminoacyl-tRNA deacylase n=1 Tax=Cryptococcus amylolentus CBS 6039 TaxID=1295533 RepID=A0A1E3I824_9TREE|nr:D-tyrosyl-tRNA(Tyr) deacylase [Cryptococcus amylolentus CBS 6039]ODN84727.1 D-tyrosyl-tRNA(Tyr) deacylase [Cryptococcus amylolentus CBS 6039]
MPTTGLSRSAITRSTQTPSKKPSKSPRKNRNPPSQKKASNRGPYAEKACYPCRKGHRKCRDIRTITGKPVCGLCADQQLECTWPDDGPPTGHGRTFDRWNNTYTSRDPPHPSWDYTSSEDDAEGGDGDSNSIITGQDEEGWGSEHASGRNQGVDAHETHHNSIAQQIDSQASPARTHHHSPQTVRPRPRTQQTPRVPTNGLQLPRFGQQQPPVPAATASATGDTSVSDRYRQPSNSHQAPPPQPRYPDPLELLVTAAAAVEGKRSALDDEPADATLIIKKILTAKLWDDDNGGGWKKNVKDIDGEVLCVSQFTLLASLKKGAKPDFHDSMASFRRDNSTIPSKAYYTSFLEEIKAAYDPSKIQDGEFGAMMQVSLCNDGPVTILLSSRDKPATKSGTPTPATSGINTPLPEAGQKKVKKPKDKGTGHPKFAAGADKEAANPLGTAVGEVIDEGSREAGATISGVNQEEANRE